MQPWWRRSKPLTPPPSEPAAAVFVYVKVPLAATGRGARQALSSTLSDALQWRLQQADMGSVVSTGDSLGQRDAQGLRQPAWLRLDIEVQALTPARKLLREGLDAAGAPDGCEIHFTRHDRRLQDRRVAGQWQLELPGGD